MPLQWLHLALWPSIKNSGGRGRGGILSPHSPLSPTRGPLYLVFQIQSRTPSLRGQHCHSRVRTMPKVTGPGIRATRFHGARPTEQFVLSWPCQEWLLGQVSTLSFHRCPLSEEAENEAVKNVLLISTHEFHRFYLQILGGGGSSWR